MNKSVPSGRIAADPNPVPRSQLATGTATTVTWTARNTAVLEVRLGAPDGPLVTRSGPLGSARIGSWLQDRMTFYLQNVEGGKPPAPEHTLDTVTVQPASSPDKLRWGDLRRVTPISRNWGYDRGQPVDRYYIENFLGAHATDIRGRVLEIGNDAYTLRFGGAEVSKSDVLNLRDDVPGTTIVGDLSDGARIPSDAFDCIISTQTLQYVTDPPAAVRTLLRALRPGGVLLATFPGISQTYDAEWQDLWYWAFTIPSAHLLFDEVFGGDNVAIEGFGSVLTAVSFLEGLASRELTFKELDACDPGYVVTITVRATKVGAGEQ